MRSARGSSSPARAAPSPRRRSPSPPATLAVVAVLDAARREPGAEGDAANAAHAQLVAVRRPFLLGRVRDAERSLAERDWVAAPPALSTVAELALADVALRQARAGAARQALDRAREAARRAGNPMLVAEVEHSARVLGAPAARLVDRGRERVLDLDGVEAVLSSPGVVVDACRRAVRDGDRLLSLARRPVLFALARALAEAWPSDATREALVGRAFGAVRPNESHRARLRVEVGRLRRELRGIVGVRATPRGFALHPGDGRPVVVLAPPVDEVDSALLALLADGTAWSTSALALAHGSSQRGVQRALSALESAGRVRSLGRARARRWLANPFTGFTTTLLLPATLSSD